MTKYALLGAALIALSSPAFAEVKTQSDAGFVIIHSRDVLAKPDEVWKRLLAPKDWWSPSHSWSGSADGFYIDPQANGCFCELFQEKDKDGKAVTKGSVEHMRVIFSQPGKVLRMQGALGPLQSEAVLGTLTVAMEPLKSGAGTKVSFSYVVGGYMRYKTAEIAPNVDSVLGEQMDRMVKTLGKVVAGDLKLGPGLTDDKKAPVKVEPKPASEAKPPIKIEPKAEPTKAPPAKADPKTEPKKSALDKAVEAIQPETKAAPAKTPVTADPKAKAATPAKVEPAAKPKL
jgi:hypothetical protein